MRTTKIAISVLLILCMVLNISGCNINKIKDTVDNVSESTTKLVYYTIGTPDKDLKIVNEELNKILKRKYNLTIEYNKIDWSEYGKRITTMIDSGDYFDIAFATSPLHGDFIKNARKGAWLALDPYLNNEGKDMYNEINPLYWKAVSLNGKIYGIPTNKEIAVPEQFMYSKELVEKYDIDIKKYTTLDSLEPLLKLIKEREPEYIGFDFSNQGRNYFRMDGYETIINDRIPLMLHSEDKNLKVINILKTDIGYQRLNTIRKYYKEGYINKDAALKETGGLVKGEKVFCKMSSGGPYSETIWSNERGYEIIAQQVSPKVVTNESARGGIMVVNSKTKYPEQCVKFLNALNTDSEVRNLINFGIQGKHYKLTLNNQVQKISNDYSGVQYTQGNWFILNTMVGEPLNKWKVFREFNKDAYTSTALGFTPDLSILNHTLLQIEKVCDKYFSAIITGTVDIDKYLPMYIEELDRVGLSEVQTELQRQLNEWSKNKG